jgi:cobalt-zinc-cadmium efflux system protein
MGTGHDHSISEICHEKPLWWALVLTGGFLIAEITGAFLTNSLALLSDATHMASDTAALLIALVAVRMSRCPPDAKRTFGYVRIEAVGAMVSGMMLFAVAGYILWEAIERFRYPPEVATIGILIIAGIGLVINLIAMYLLKAGSSESLNVKGAYLEVWSDMLGSVAVLIGTAIIIFTGWKIIDSILGVLIGLWILPRTWTLVHEAGNVLMEGAPKGMDTGKIRAALSAVPGVASVHDLHVWALSSAKPAMAAHIVVPDKGDDTTLLQMQLTELLETRFGIQHVTLQVESSACEGPHCEIAEHI